MLIKRSVKEGALKIKGDWIRWDEMSLDELKIQIALNTLSPEQLYKLLKSMKLSDECTGWLYKHLEGNRSSYYTFTTADEKREKLQQRVHTILKRLERREKRLLERQIVNQEADFKF